MLQAYRFRIYPTDEQKEAIERNFGCARYVYNHYLEKRRYLYEKDGKKMSRFDCMRDLTLHKREEPWLKEADSAALKYAITHLDFAYQNFFRRVKRGENPGYPRFKSKKDRHQSYKTFPRIKGEQSVFLPKIGNVECRISRPVEGRIVSGTVSRTPSDRYFVSLTCESPEKEQLPLTGENIGLSNSAKGILAASSLGDLFMSCNTLEENLDRIAMMQRRMQQKTPGSKRYEKARVQLAKLHEHIANQRLDALHKLSTDLIRRYDVICLPEVPVAKAIQSVGREKARMIGGEAWNEFVRQLTYKAEWYGKKVVRVKQENCTIYAGSVEEGVRQAQEIFETGMAAI